MGSDGLQLSILGQEAGSRVERWVSCLTVADFFTENLHTTKQNTIHKLECLNLHHGSSKSNVVVADFNPGIYSCKYARLT